MWHRCRQDAPAAVAASSPDGSSGFAAEMIAREYESIRAESNAARESQQTTLNWSLAGLAAVFGAAVLYTSTSLRSGRPETSVDLAIFVFLYGVLIPGLAFAAALTYAGEIVRMERAGYFLRGLERVLRDSTSYGRPPLIWESFLQFGDKNDPQGGEKTRLPYIGGFGLYSGAMLTAGAAIWLPELARGPMPTWYLVVAIVIDALVVVAVGFLGWQARGVVRRSGHAADHSAVAVALRAAPNGSAPSPQAGAPGDP